jgi:hypothetical protein
MRWDIVLLVANAAVLAFNIWAEYLWWSCFSAMAVGMLIGKFYHEEQMRRELASRRRSLTALFSEAKPELGR